MPICQRWAYFDHAAVGPIPQKAANALSLFAQQASLEGDFHWPAWSASANETRKLAAELLHASQEEIALVSNTTLGIHTIALAYPFKPSDSVVILKNEFPSNQIPWLNLRTAGVDVRIVEPNPDGSICIDRVLDAIDSTTRLVAISWVGYATGYRIDLASLVEQIHLRGAEVFLDAIQGLGVFPLNVSDIPVDYLAADGHKWLLGPEGAGILFIQKNHLNKLGPALCGWNSLQASHEFRLEGKGLKDSAARYEGGSLNHVGFAALKESLSLLLEHGCHDPASGFAERILHLTNYARERLRTAGASFPWFTPQAPEKLTSNASGILSFDFPDQNPQLLRKALIDAGIILSVRHGSLRIAIHAYNIEQEIDHLVDSIASIIRPTSTHFSPNPQP
jgi:selenocysteine lyase/cysteine desulfurase